MPVDLLLNDVLDLPEAGCVLSEMPVQKNGSDPAGDCVQGDELKKEISALKKWMIALVAVVTALVLTAAVYVVGNLRKGSDAIPIDELEQEYIGDSFDGEFDHGW